MGRPLDVNHFAWVAAVDLLDDGTPSAIVEVSEGFDFGRGVHVVREDEDAFDLDDFLAAHQLDEEGVSVVEEWEIVEGD